MTSLPRSDLLRTVSLGVQTLTRMEPRQVRGMAERKVRNLVVPRLPVDFDAMYEARVPADPGVRTDAIAGNTATLRDSLADDSRGRCRGRAREAADGAPSFLNRTLRIADGADVDWYDDRLREQPLDWSLKLYAFQPLSWVTRGFDPGAAGTGPLQATFDGWIRDWIASVDVGRSGYLRRAWTPWAVSLRIINVGRYLAWRTDDAGGSDGEFPRMVARELYKNALFLHNHVEWDVGGNHLVENGAALVVAGRLFGEPAWTDAGLAVLQDAADEQFLSNGFHFERSPMYHIAVLTRYLTVCGLLERAGRRVPPELRRTAVDATGFLEYLRPPDGRMPLLNDAVHEEALALDDCLAYATAIDIGTDTKPDRPRASGSNDRAEHSSGYCWLRTDAGAMLVDGDRVGPNHLPGHAHSDTLGVHLWLDGRPVVTDTGTFGYTSGELRDYARGVRGHNTVQVGDCEPVAVGGTFLMGARPDPTTRLDPGAVSLFEGRYTAPAAGCPGYTHHRAVYAADDWWLLRDTVDGHEGASTRNRLHLHPDVTPSIESTGRVRLAVGDGAAYVDPLATTEVAATPGWYFPRFGEAVARPVLELHGGAPDVGEPAAFGCLISDREFDDVTLEGANGRVTPTRVTIDGETRRLPAPQLLPE